MTDALFTLLLPAGFGAAAVLALSVLLFALGRAAQNCPEAGPPIRAASLGVAATFTPVGLGLVLLIAASAQRLLETDPLNAGLTIVGLSMIVGGVGFAIAAATLRDTAMNINRQVKQTSEADG